MTCAVLDLLDALVRKSLLVADRSSGRTRFSMLETIRDFAEEQANPKPGSQKSLANAVMRANCVRHLVATVNILQPTLVISQGWTLVDTLWDSLGVTHEVDLNLDGCHLTDCDLDGNRFVWVALKHPTRLWRSATQTYFVETVDPAISEARRRALALARTG